MVIASPRRVSVITHFTHVRNFRPKKFQSTKHTKKIDRESRLGILDMICFASMLINSIHVFLCVNNCIQLDLLNPRYTLGLNIGELLTVVSPSGLITSDSTIKHR